MYKKIIFLLAVMTISFSCADKQSDNFYREFVDPPAEARPFVRWWWNGNHINTNEIKRELDVLKNAGIGGVEINPIAMPKDAVDIGTEPVRWLSEEWNKLLATACNEAHGRGMIADMIVGSGWPFGGEFLKQDEYTQRVVVNRIQLSGPAKKEYALDELMEQLKKTYQERNRWAHIEGAEIHELLFASLVPADINDASQTINLMDNYKDETISVFFEKGDYELIYGIRQRGHRKVMHGALGASGNVMDHYSKQITREYLERLKKIAEDTGIPLKKLLRALFCDSIELAGANWTDGFAEMFEQAYGYSLKPYLPFIFYQPHAGYQDDNYNDAFKDELKRVRYDYNNLLVDVFLDNFTRTFQDFCTENGLQCRYQAYGTPFLMGMLEGYMIPDIPESNNWIYSAEMDGPRWTWSKGHGYMIWNHYAAAGGHLKDRKIISCEAMTNTRGVFRTSMEEIKQHDDMNFISGINHSVLHGFNYSPPEAGFPGWIRYGAYFNEHNTWWPYFKKWTDYNARLSYVFQQSQAVKSLAVLGPVGDIWSNVGLNRTYFHMHPWYLHELWQSLSQNGSSCDYINEHVLQGAELADGTIKYGPMQYKALWVGGVQSMHPQTAHAIRKYVEGGGKVVLIDSIPGRSLSLKDGHENDTVVQYVFKSLQEKYPEQVFCFNSPQKDNLMQWTGEVLRKTAIQKDVNISVPDSGLYQIHQTMGDKDIYFFTNTWRKKSLDFTAEFPVKGKTPWIWNPETGDRKVYPYKKQKNRLQITLRPLESLLLVFDPAKDGAPGERKFMVDQGQYVELNNPWNVTLKHVNGKEYKRSFDTLFEFTAVDDKILNTFAGQVIYETVFENKKGHTVLTLNNVNEGITEVWLNGKKVGCRWYGNHNYNLEGYLAQGDNKLKIIYTTVLFNYCKSLQDNATARQWTDPDVSVPTGIEGPVKLCDKK